MYLLEVKKPDESTKEWDYFKVLATIPGEEAFIDPAESGCPRSSRSDRGGGWRARPLPPAGSARSSAGFVAVRDVDIDVRDGQIKALIGPNGAGKSTVFNLLTKFIKPTAGQITFLGQDITRLDPARVARMGLVRSFQISAVFPHLTVLDNVRVALQRPQGLGHQFWLGLGALDRLECPRARAARRGRARGACRRAARRTSPTGASGCSRSRPRSRSSRACCCSTSRWRAWDTRTSDTSRR